MTVERNYAFRQRLDQVHRPERRDADLRPEADEVALDDGWRIAVPATASPYLVGVAQDLQDYLFTSMGVSTLLVRAGAETGARVIALGTGAPDRAAQAVSVPRSYRLRVAPDRVDLWGCGERGLGQGCYHLEDLMNLREAPFLRRAQETREPVFCPRMVHSGWGLDQFPDPHLKAIAHAGFDAILVFAKGVNRTTTGHLDIEELIGRAARFGLDVYLYSCLISRRHPADADAEAFYESTYGELLRAHPGARPCRDTSSPAPCSTTW